MIIRNKGIDLDDRLELPIRPDAKYRALERKLKTFAIIDSTATDISRPPG